MFNVKEQVAKESKEAMDCLRQIMPLSMHIYLLPLLLKK